eukprot:6282464-Lingulodinium_polyedra.AAC.1
MLEIELLRADFAGLGVGLGAALANPRPPGSRIEIGLLRTNVAGVGAGLGAGSGTHLGATGLGARFA